MSGGNLEKTLLWKKYAMPHYHDRRSDVKKFFDKIIPGGNNKSIGVVQQTFFTDYHGGKFMKDISKELQKELEASPIDEALKNEQKQRVIQELEAQSEETKLRQKRKMGKNLTDQEQKFLAERSKPGLSVRPISATPIVEDREVVVDDHDREEEEERARMAERARKLEEKQKKIAEDDKERNDERIASSKLPTMRTGHAAGEVKSPRGPRARRPSVTTGGGGRSF